MPIARAALYVATAGALAVVVKGIVMGPPPLWMALGVLAAYLALVTSGVVLSRFGMFADVVCRGPKGARGVALTFDDGPHPTHTPRILELLAAAGAKASFFIIGRKAEQHPELVREILRQGHAVGVHGFAHDRLFSLRSTRTVRRDLEQALGAVEAATDQRPMLFRAPIGHVSPGIARVARELGLVIVGWSIRGVDGWRGAKPRRVAERIMPRLRDGAIVLLHDAAERDDFVPASVRALPHILEAGARKRLEFVSLADWHVPELEDQAR